MRTTLRIFLLVCFALFRANAGFAQSAIYSQAFQNGVTPTTQCTLFQTFCTTTLNPGIYLSVKISGTFDPTGINCPDAAIANAVANALKTSTNYTSPLINGHVWSVCNRGSYMELWLDPPSQCNGSNCPSGYIIRPCLGNLNWGGVNTATCTSNPSQTMTLEFFYGVPCSGVPVDTVLAPTQVCPNKNFDVKLSVPFTGTTFQWAYSTDGLNWTNYTGPVGTTGTITHSITQPTWYRCKITCTSSNQVYITPPVLVNIAPFYYCYCDGSKATTASGMDVGNVTVNALPGGTTLLNNGTATPFLSNSTSGNTYSEFRYTVPPIPMYHDSTYGFKVSQIISSATFTAGTSAIYIDYNRNGTFDAFERVLLGTTAQIPPTPGLVLDTFTIPDTAGYGLTGMRVILKTGTTAPDTCLSYTDGETEDYLVDLRYLPCDKVKSAGVVEGDTSVCTGYDYLLTDTSYQKKQYGLSKMWQVSADGVSWVDIAGSANKDTISRVFTGQPLYYRLRMVCGVTNDTLNAAPHKVNLKAAYKCYCFSQSNGTSKDSSDIGSFHIYNFEINDGGAHLSNPRATRKRQDFTDMPPIELIVDSMYQLRVFHTMPRDQHADAKITVFMDFNNNHKYDIPQERVFTGFTDVAYHTVLSNIMVPDSAITNMPTGMRIILNNDVSPNVPSDEACGTYTSGETEDYMIMFKRPFLTGVQELRTGVQNMQLFPNPNTGKFMLHFYSMQGGEVNVKVMTMTGQSVLNKSYGHKGGWFTEEINMSGHAKGVYYVEMDASGSKTTRKIVIR